MFAPAANQQSYGTLVSAQQYTLRVGLSSSSQFGQAGGGDNSSGVGSNERQDAFQRTLTMGYAKLEAQFASKLEGPVAAFDVGPLSAEKVAGNILGFIERRLALDVADGASPDALESRLEAGLSGFKKGFAEAEEQLKALSMLTPEIEEDIGQTYDLVIAGIEDLREKFLGAESEVEGEVQKPADTESLAKSTLAASQYDYARANSFSFSLKTADGDTVTIDASASQAMSLSAAYSSDSEGVEQAAFSLSQSQSDAFSLSVTGELDEGELKAINDLLGQVNDLADDFFAGDLDEAFNAALELGYDSSEITSYSLNLTQVEVQRMSTAYQVSPGEGGAPSLDGVGKFTRDLIGAVDTARVFDQPLSLIQQLTEQIANMHGDKERLPSFVEQVMDGLELA